MADALRNFIGDEDCLKPALSEMKLEPADSDGPEVHQTINIRKADKIRAILTDHVSPESHRTVENILDQVHKLPTLDKLLLYLKLPTGRPAEVCDPLRQPLNPLGSRSEIQLTINWIRSHYEEDAQVSLPKHEVYDDYTGYCSVNSVKPLSTADFGKVMKQVFPAVRPRRLGTRGNSRYCYAGLRKRLKLDPPVTPDISAEPGRARESLPGGEEEVSNASSFLIREWVEKLLGVKFETLPDLASHLLEKMYVDNRSVAAFTLMSRSGKFDVKTGLVSVSNGSDNKLQLQRKLQDGGQVNIKQPDQHKRKLSDQEILIGKRSKLGEPDNSYDVNLNYESGGVGVGGVVLAAPEPKLSDNQSRYSLASVVVQNSHSQTQQDHVMFNGGSVAGISFEGSSAPEFQVSYNGDRMDMAGLGRPAVPGSISLDKLPRKKQVVLVGGGELANGLPTTSVIKAGEKPRNKYKEEVEVKESVVWSGDIINYDEPADLSGIRVATNWSGGSSSDNQEEELVQYFPQAVQDTDREKLSELRQLLAKNLISPGSGSSGAFKRTSLTSLPLRDTKLETVISSTAVMESPDQVTNTNITQLSGRRRVSFHPLIVSEEPAESVAPVSQSGSCPIPPSPGTRRRHFSFQPISPRQANSGQSPPASPFISPRSTPVHMLRSRHSSGSALPLHLLPGNSGGRQQHPSGSGSDISRAATFGSASESSTPFISPQGTPIPFNRSRHNSAQGRLCRSRHSSGVPLERQYSRQYSGSSVQAYTGTEPALDRQYSTTATPYSPMALSNLNNPFSPQPSQLELGENTVYSQVQPAPLFVTDRSRHSSAGSDGAQCQARSAPLSPYSEGGGVGVRQRHMSAGHVPVTSSHTIHYRPDTFDISLPAPPYSHYTAVLGPATNGELSQHSSYRNTPIPQNEADCSQTDFSRLINPVDDELVESVSAVVAAEAKNKDDDLDLALDALRDCDTDFMKFDQENSVSN